jgi:hypothetical protein
MGAISIRGVNEELARRLKNEAKIAKKSLNQLVLEIISQHVGLNKKKQFSNKYHDMDELFGKWSEAEFNVIQGKVDAERRIDEELWK